MPLLFSPPDKGGKLSERERGQSSRSTMFDLDQGGWLRGLPGTRFELVSKG
jgi:hypothetical protein